jgi:hypothetical protein
MKAIVVYESQWGNTAAVAEAIAEGMGPETKVMTTDEAHGEAIAGADLIVAGSPLLGFSLPTEQMVADLPKNPLNPAAAHNASRETMRAWLNSLPAGAGRAAAFETRIWWSPGSAAKAISKSLEASGRTIAAEPQKFIVTGKYGPLKDGELDRAGAWGKLLASL